MNPIDTINLQLDDHPDDWECRMVLADAYEDKEDSLMAQYYRWTAEKKKCPQLHTHESLYHVPPSLEEKTRWMWWSVSDCRDYELDDWIEFQAYWLTKIGGNAFQTFLYLSQTKRIDAEKMLAEFLRHKGVI